MQVIDMSETKHKLEALNSIFLCGTGNDSALWLGMSNDRAIVKLIGDILVFN